MSHATAWVCRTCRTPLGQVRNGVLYPSVPVGSVDEQGVAHIPCPGCGRVRVWKPSVGEPMRQDLDRSSELIP
jgi:hypothetical protein